MAYAPSKKSASAIGSLLGSFFADDTNHKVPEEVVNELMTSQPNETNVTGTTYFAKHGNVYTITPDPTMDLHKRLPAGNYVMHPQIGFYLETTDTFDIPKIIYGNTESQAKRILNTFKDRPHTTGILLVGEQGSGKTLLAKMISAKAAKEGMPTLLVNAPFVGDSFNTFLASIHQPVIVFFDEFEKVYDKDHQPFLLTMLDGVYGGNKLYLMTANDKYRIDVHLKNRPGRFFYFMEFRGLSKEFIEQYCERNLKDKSNIQGILNIVTMFHEINFDMLQAMVEEMNRYGETPAQSLEFLNVKPTFEFQETYKVTLVADGAEIDMDQHSTLEEGEWNGNPFNGVSITFQYYVTELALDEDGDPKGHWCKTKFTLKDMKSYDAQKGILKFTNSKGEELTMVRKERATSFSYRDYL